MQMHGAGVFLLLFLLQSTRAARWVSVNTTADHAYSFLNDLGVRVKDGTLVFEVTSSQDAILRFSKTQSLSGSTYDVIIGSCSNACMTVRENCGSCTSTLVAYGTFLNEAAAASFWLDWRSDTTLQGGEGTVIGQSVLFSYTWTDRFEANYIAAANWYGHTGQWNFRIDTAPSFLVPSPDGSTVVDVPENEPTGNTVITLSARDNEGDSITFSVIGHYDSILECQGFDVVLTGQLDFETERVMTVMIMASDDNFNTTVTFTLRLSNVIDEAPVLTSGPVTSITEEMPNGTAIRGLFTVTDEDENDRLSFSLAGSHSQYFAINESTGEIAVANRIDRDGLGGLSRLDDVSVGVTDGARQVTWLSLVLDVEDINDNRPIFDSDVYSVNVTTDHDPNTPLVTFNVTDADTGSNSDVTLRIVDDWLPDGLNVWLTDRDLHFNVSSGDTSDGLFSFTVTVRADDSPEHGPSLTAYALVRVQVFPVNHHSPVWISPVPDSSGEFPRIDVPEDTAIGTTFLILTASDADTGYYGHVTYFVLSAASDNGSDASSVFSLISTSGSLTLASGLDRDRSPGSSAWYLLFLTAIDPGGLSTEAILNITITDVNDNTPVFSQRVYKANISCDAHKGVTLTTLTSSDNDVTSVTAYEIIQGDRTLFELDSVSGDVTLLRDLTDVVAVSSVHVLTVTVRDGGVPEMTSTAVVVLFLENCSESAVSTVSIPSSSSSTGTPTSSSSTTTLTSASDNVHALSASSKSSSSSVTPSSVSSATDVNEWLQAERLLQIACGVLGVGFVVSVTMQCVSKYKPRSHVQPFSSPPGLTSASSTPETVKRKGGDDFVSQNSLSISSRDSGAVTELTDCSSLQSLTFGSGARARADGTDDSREVTNDTDAYT